MPTMSFIADVNKTVTVEGNVYTITVPTIPTNVHLLANEVELVAGQPVSLTENMTLTVNVDVPEASTVTITHTNTNTATYDGTNITSGQSITVAPGAHTIDFVGATAIPSVIINGEGINKFTVNALEHQAAELPFTFVPQGGVTNNVFIDGSAGENKRITIAGTDIETLTINNVDTPLPYSAFVEADLNIAVSGKIYNVDLTSLGGVKLDENGTTINDGNSTLHKVIPVNKDIYIQADGTHTLSIDGTDIKNISFNGIVVPVENLPVSLKNSKMNATVIVHGFEPSEVHVVGQYLDTVTVDGSNIPIGENGTIDFELTTVNNNHFINITGSQPREYGITWNDNATTTLKMDGKVVTSGTTTMISKDVYVSATPLPIPVHFEVADTATVQVDGKKYDALDFTVSVDEQTEIDITTDTCNITIDYGDNSYRINVPQALVTFTAPHRDGWIFDSWSSNDLGIDNAKSVRTTVNLVGKSSGHLVAHYQRCLTINKPNMWN